MSKVKVITKENLAKFDREMIKKLSPEGLIGYAMVRCHLKKALKKGKGVRV